MATEAEYISDTASVVEPVERVSIEQSDAKTVYRFIKRVVDFVVSLFVLLLLLIPMIIISIIVSIDTKASPIFKQDRVGKDGRIFTIYKFRSMEKDAPNCISTKDFEKSSKYITKIGRFLRKTSIDELPQLVNIIKGDMSIVGYRPLCVSEEEVNSLRKEKGVLAVRPGLTGLAQVNGRDNVSDADKIGFDLYYVRNLSFVMDLRCILKTIKVVLLQKDIKS